MDCEDSEAYEASGNQLEGGRIKTEKYVNTEQTATGHHYGTDIHQSINVETGPPSGTDNQVPINSVTDHQYGTDGADDLMKINFDSSSTKDGGTGYEILKISDLIESGSKTNYKENTLYEDDHSKTDNNRNDAAKKSNHASVGISELSQTNAQVLQVKPHNLNEKSAICEKSEANGRHGSEAIKSVKGIDVKIKTVAGLNRMKSQCRCDVCGIFVQKRRLRSHILTHACRRYTCAVCYARFMHKVRLRKHVLAHVAERKYKCTKCAKQFYHEQRLEFHTRTHCHEESCPFNETAEKRLNCVYCRKKFVHPQKLEDHLLEHKHGRKYECDFCEMKFRKRDHLKSHLRVHVEQKPNACDVCDKKFATKNWLNIHKRVHTGEKPFICGVCDAGFISKVRLQIHIRIHTGEKPYKCETCHKRFNQRANLITHTQHVHSATKPFKCEFCGKQFTNRDYLQRHLYVHPESGLKLMHECNVCLKKFPSKARLNRHKVFHSDRFKCPICDTSYVTESRYLNHMALHAKDQVHFCKVCGCQCKSAQGLAYHMLKHDEGQTSSERIRQNCHICGFTCHTEKTLKFHILLHNDPRALRCEFCNYLTRKKSKLEKHSKHKNACRKCKKSFKSKQSLANHLSRKTCVKPNAAVVGNKTHDTNARIDSHQSKVLRRKIPFVTIFPRVIVKRHSFLQTKQSLYQCKVCGMKFQCYGAVVDIEKLAI